MLSNEKLLTVLRRQINFDRDQKAAAIGCWGTSVLDLENFVMFVMRRSLLYSEHF
jgi:hypothetical protein